MDIIAKIGYVTCVLVHKPEAIGAFNDILAYYRRKCEIKQKIDEKVKLEINQEIKLEINQEDKQEVKQENNQEVNQEINQDVNRENKQENNQEVKQEITNHWYQSGTMYSFFCEKYMDDVKQELGPGATTSHVFARLGTMWNDLKNDKDKMGDFIQEYARDCLVQVNDMLESDVNQPDDTESDNTSTVIATTTATTTTTTATTTATTTNTTNTNTINNDSTSIDNESYKVLKLCINSGEKTSNIPVTIPGKKRIKYWKFLSDMDDYENQREKHGSKECECILATTCHGQEKDSDVNFGSTLTLRGFEHISWVLSKIFDKNKPNRFPLLEYIDLSETSVTCQDILNIYEYFSLFNTGPFYRNKQEYLYPENTNSDIVVKITIDIRDSVYEDEICQFVSECMHSNMSGLNQLVFYKNGTMSENTPFCLEFLISKNIGAYSVSDNDVCDDDE